MLSVVENAIVKQQVVLSGSLRSLSVHQYSGGCSAVYLNGSFARRKVFADLEGCSHPSQKLVVDIWLGI